MISDRWDERFGFWRQKKGHRGKKFL